MIDLISRARGLSLMGGFECSTHRTRPDRRLDLIEASGHDRFALADYERLLEIGMRTARDGLRWHLIEREPYKYDFSSLRSQAAAVRATGIDVIWDYFHYGFPEDIDILSPEFPIRFASFAGAASEYLIAETGQLSAFCPVNEISFFSWAAGRVGIFYPFKKTKAAAIKRQLVRAAIMAIDAVREVCPDVRVVMTEPAIHVIPANGTPAARRGAAAYTRAQFEALDMLVGRREPQLGGGPEYLDIIGLNYYVHNQWTYPGRRTVWPDDPRYRPPHEVFIHVYERYRRPMILAETGIEDDERERWFRFIISETEKAQAAGVPLSALCLYPIVDHPGWVDDRHCCNGLWGYPDENGGRKAHTPLESAIREYVSAQTDADAGRDGEAFAATGK